MEGQIANINETGPLRNRISHVLLIIPGRFYLRLYLKLHLALHPKLYLVMLKECG
jgi:hypothetical protein